ncbi:accessory Sec system glycosyltransferase Asp1 [Lactiplantibacillus fabifermentans]|uniref:Poly(Glycerol-phosphate) alpha-glucosyltransferase n=2 Tax=Lactiplantibacillus fabifermentans TaxID=483011 RepID=A0A0R2NYQ9_9LACO|nr:accessory Sec system glycosyltransferase Asp1 [Lactiplantibacillus fabifermentans]ETY73355.1 poly(glycerol-phosphate) alpha-glucosyltransferase [Lactiplantibacillus fabifermentans T30PCM01]KRO28627.1 poly(glycerol-phosphate) alpha-glucosyltransferase [Lactiplantibacillus fabifermentans DSM 21115]
MDFFVNQYVMALNSGVEHAEFKRLQLFKAHQAPAKMVTRQFDALLHQNMRRFQIEDDQMANLFDFFRGTTSVDAKVLKIDDLNWPGAYNIKPDPNVSEVVDGDRTVAKVHFVPSTVGHVYFVEIFDRFNNLVQRTDYDERGFKARDQFYSPAKEPITDIFYRPDGTRMAEQYYAHNSNGANYVSLCKLINYNGQDYYFNGENEWYRFFLDELNRTNGGNNNFIADRPLAAQWPVINMQTPAKKYLWLPTPHAVDPRDQVYSNLNSAYIYGLHQYLSALDGIITNTSQQKADLTKWLGASNTVPVYAISAGVVSAEQGKKPAVKMAARHAHEIIYSGRLDPERRVDQLIQAFARVRRSLKDATLQIHGYGGAIDDLKKQVADLNLTEAVAFVGYQPDLDAAYDQAGAYAYTGESDSQPLSMIEALGHGVPVVAYDINYGPREVIKDGKNGYLIKDGAVNQLASALIRTLENPKRQQKLSDGAYKSSQAYSDAEVWEQWQQLK